MAFKQTMLFTNDRSGSGRARVIHTYARPKRMYSSLGQYIKSTIRVISRLPARIRGKRFRPLRVGFIVRGSLVCAAAIRSLYGAMSISTERTAHVLIKRRGVFRSKHILGPLQRPRLSKRFRGYFNIVLFKMLVIFDGSRLDTSRIFTRHEKLWELPKWIHNASIRRSMIPTHVGFVSGVSYSNRLDLRVTGQNKPFISWFCFPENLNCITGDFEFLYQFKPYDPVANRHNLLSRPNRQIFIMKPGYRSIWIELRQRLNAVVKLRFRRQIRLSKWVATASRACMGGSLAPIESVFHMPLTRSHSVRWAGPASALHTFHHYRRGPIDYIGVANWMYNWNYSLF